MAIAGRSYANVPVIVRGSLEDPSDFGSKTAVLVVAAPADPRWFRTAPPVIAASPQPPAAAAAAPAPVVVTSAPPLLKTVQAYITRNTLADAPVLTTPQPVVIAAPPAARWFAPGVILTAAGSPLAAGPPVAQQGTASVTLALAAAVTISNQLAGSVTIVNDL